MRITRVYTRAGDGGETALGGGQRLRKDHPRIEACGAVDELSSAIGLALSAAADAWVRETLTSVQHQLFDLGGDLCMREEDKARLGIPPFAAERVPWLEGTIDRANEELGPLKEFVLPGGEPAAAHLHVARCACRRAERRCVALAALEPISPQVVPYLNRLSDALFVLARIINKRAGRGDVAWQKAERPGPTGRAPARRRRRAGTGPR